MPDGAAWTKSRPASGGWHRVLVAGGCLVMIVALAAVVFFFRQRRHTGLEQNWKCATAKIEDVRSRVKEQVTSTRGGGVVLYEVSILTKYVSDGAYKEQWITVEQPPVTLAEFELETFRWKGQQCVVRWKRTAPDEPIAEVD